MAQATLNIDGLAFCTLGIDGSDMPPSMNMIENIYILEGFGMGLPAIKMSLFDENETLSRELNLQNGTKITLRMGRSATESPEMNFRVFGWGRPRNSQGKVLHVVGIYDAPMFGAGSYSESFEGNSSAVMQEIASRSGLQYDGPKTPTSDNQVWLNLNTTRLSFSEDVAMRGFTDEKSCMARAVSMDGVLHYKNLMEVLAQPPKATIVHNSDGGGTEGTTISVRSVKDTSVSGIFTHFMNFGFKLFGHTFGGEDFAAENLDVDAQGAGVPVNEEIAGSLERGSRVASYGFDHRSGPAPGFNLHENYERAYYQNLRLLGLFSERVTALSDYPNDVKLFDPVEYHQGAGAKGSAKAPPADVSGRYILGGRTKVIKKGTKYAEVYYLYRPFVTEAGNKGGARAPKRTGKASQSGVDTGARNFE